MHDWIFTLPLSLVGFAGLIFLLLLEQKSAVGTVVTGTMAFGFLGLTIWDYMHRTERE